MAVDLYLSVDKPYSSHTTDTTKQIQVNSFSFGVSNAVNASGSGGTGAGKPSISDLSLTTSDGDASTGLLNSALMGDRHTYYLSLVKAGASQTPFETFQLQNGVISSFQESAASGGDNPTDSISIAFSKFNRSYYAQKPDGTFNTPTQTTYDVTTNKVAAAKISPTLDATLATTPTDESFTFKSGSVHDVVSVLRSARGQAAVAEIHQDFSSLAAVIAAAEPSSDGSGTIITLPNQNTITLAGLSEKDIKADAKQLAHMFFS